MTNYPLTVQNLKPHHIYESEDGRLALMLSSLFWPEDMNLEDKIVCLDNGQRPFGSQTKFRILANTVIQFETNEDGACSGVVNYFEGTT